MNIWQKMFLVFAVAASVLLFLFPPQVTGNGDVMFLLFTYSLPIDWLRMFFWLLGILLVAGLGISVNKEEHQ